VRERRPSRTLQQGLCCRHPVGCPACRTRAHPSRTGHCEKKNPMKYTNVYIESLAYRLPPVSSRRRNSRSASPRLYEALHISPGQLEYITGIAERRWWQPGQSLALAAAAAARRPCRRGHEAPGHGSHRLRLGQPRALRTATRLPRCRRLGIAARLGLRHQQCLPGRPSTACRHRQRIQLGEIRAGWSWRARPPARSTTS